MTVEDVQIDTVHGPASTDKFQITCPVANGCQYKTPVFDNFGEAVSDIQLHIMDIHGLAVTIDENDGKISNVKPLADRDLQ